MAENRTGTCGIGLFFRKWPWALLSLAGKVEICVPCALAFCDDGCDRQCAGVREAERETVDTPMGGDLRGAPMEV